MPDCIIGIALAPAFKMKFWNIGAEGQVLMGGVVTAIIMVGLGPKIPAIILFPKYIFNLFKAKNMFQLGCIITFAIYAIAYFLAREYGWLSNNIALYSSTIVLALLGILLCGEILHGIKKNPANITTIPFGPALVLSAFLVIAFLPIA